MILLADSVDEARRLKAAHPGSLAMGEDHGRRPAGFDFSNSPVLIADADLDGRTLVQRTSAGTPRRRRRPVGGAFVVRQPRRRLRHGA